MAKVFDFIQSLVIIKVENLEILGIKIDLKSPLEAFEEASTKLSHLVEGKGWEAQAAALIYTISLAATNPYPDGTLLRDNNSQAVHIVQGGAAFWVRSEDQFNLMGLDWNAIRGLKNNSMVNMPRIPRHGSLLREYLDRHVDVMDMGRKKQMYPKKFLFSPGLIGITLEWLVMKL